MLFLFAVIGAGRCLTDGLGFYVFVPVLTIIPVFVLVPLPVPPDSPSGGCCGSFPDGS